MRSAYTDEEDIIILALSALIIIANIAEVHLLMRRRKHFKPYEQLLLSLSICDLLVGISMVFLSIMDLVVQSQAEKISHTAKKTMPLWCSILLSVLHINLLSIDRYIAVHYPLRHGVWVTKQRIASLIISTWTACVACVVIVTLCWSVQIVKDVLRDAALTGCSTLIIVYSAIIHNHFKRKKVLGGQCIQHSQHHSTEQRLVFICLLVAVFCLATNAPFIVLEYLKSSNSAGDLTLMCGSLTNPFIYYFWKYCEQQRAQRNLVLANRNAQVIYLHNKTQNKELQ